jgi:hypothetical protein
LTSKPSASTVAIASERSPTTPPAAELFVPRLTVLPADTAAVAMAVGQDDGALVPKKIAASTARPIASSRRGRISPHTSYAESSRTASGIGTIAASSSAFRYLFVQSTSVVCLRPVSPLTK